MAAKHPKSFVTLDDADHLITKPRDAEYAAEVIAAWVSKYLELKPRRRRPARPRASRGSAKPTPPGFCKTSTPAPCTTRWPTNRWPTAAPTAA